MGDAVEDTFDSLIRLLIIALLGQGHSVTFIKMLLADMRGVTKLIENGKLDLSIIQDKEAYYKFVKKMYNVDAEEIDEFDADAS